MKLFSRDIIKALSVSTIGGHPAFIDVAIPSAPTELDKLSGSEHAHNMALDAHNIFPGGCIFPAMACSFPDE